MRVRALLCCVVLVPAFFLAPATTAESPAAPKERPTYKSPLGVAVDEKGERAYVALHTAGAVAVVDLKAGKVLKEIPVGNGPHGLALLGKKAYVTCEADGTLVPIDLEQQTAEKPIRIGGTPQSLYADTDKKTLFVWVGDRERVGLEYDPRTSKAQPRNAPPFPGSYSLEREARHEVPTTQIAQGWIFLNLIATGHAFETWYLPLDEPQQAYGDLGSVLHATERHVFVVSAAADMVLVVDDQQVWAVRKAHVPGGTWRRRSGFGGYGPDPALYHDLTLSRHYITARIPTQANPRRLALSGDGKTLVVANHLADSLTVIDTKTLKVVRHIPLGGPEPDAVRRGEILFNSGKMTFHGQFTCASCHPNGGSDGRTWDLTRDGVGNFKKTKSLFGVKDTAPYGWEGSSPTLEDRIAGTLRTLHQHEPEGTEVADIAAYLRTLPPPLPSPVKDEDKPAVARGKQLFEGKAQCAKCHQGPTFQDGKAHDIGTRGETDTTNRFDTPSLRGVGRDSIFLHDGRAKTLEAVFTKHNDGKKHGAAHELSADELADLLKYLSSL